MTQGTLQSKQAIARLVELDRIRVWSFVITVFGDAVMDRGGVVASSTLAALMSEMGIKPEAFRVAMSRLVKDGWVERSKQGRLSFYQLSDKGGLVFGPASQRIYAKEAGSAEGWCLVVMPSAVEDAPEDAISLGGRTYLTRTAGDVADGLVMSGSIEAMPDWAKDRIGPEELRVGYRELFSVLSEVSTQSVSPLEAAALRSLIVHQWRRLVLRHGDLPPAFFPDDWQGEACRTLVQQLLTDLAPAAGAWFDSEIH
jgi:phenylacetic acid degradation operon negative regulatory protein